MKAAVTSFLNTYPLIWYLEQNKSQYAKGVVELIKAPPSECALLLMNNDVDYGVVPVAPYAFNQDFSMILSPCVASRSKVRTVKLYSSKDIRDITEVMVDEDSKTSAVLLQILLKYKYKNHKAKYMKYNFKNCSIHADEASYMLIGDKNFQMNEEFAYEYDLAYEWVEWVQLPFIFATWMIKESSRQPKTVSMLKKAYRMAKINFDQMCKDACSLWNLPMELVKIYFTENLSYEIGLEGIKSIKLFFEMAAELDLLPKVERIHFVDT